MRVRRALLLLANLAAAVLLQPAGAETAPPSTLPSFRTLGASLTYGLLSPPASEWNATFRAPGTGRAHVWLRCLDWTVRAYYFFEAADAPAGALLGRQTVSALASRQQGGEDGVTGVAWPGVFTVDGWPVVAYNTQHGGEWYAPVPRHAPLDGTLAVSVAGWVRGPREQCRPAVLSGT